MLLAPTAQAQDAEIGIYLQSLIDDGKVTPRLFSEGYSYLGDRSGVWGFSYLEKQYVSAVVGFYYDLFTDANSALEIGIAAGAETFPNEQSEAYELHPRLAGFVSADYKTLSSLVYYENGASGDGWLRAELDWQVTDALTLGIFHQTDDGTGPRLLFSIPKTSLLLWVAPMFGEETRLLLGAELIFRK